MRSLQSHAHRVERANTRQRCQRDGHSRFSYTEASHEPCPGLSTQHSSISYRPHTPSGRFWPSVVTWPCSYRERLHVSVLVHRTAEWHLPDLGASLYDVLKRQRYRESPYPGTRIADRRNGWERSLGKSVLWDLYAGIGYFAFSYAKAGVGKVLCWEINPWSVDGLRRGAGGKQVGRQSHQ